MVCIAIYFCQSSPLRYLGKQLDVNDRDLPSNIPNPERRIGTRERELGESD